MMRACSVAAAHLTARVSVPSTRCTSRSAHVRRTLVTASTSVDDEDGPEIAPKTSSRLTSSRQNLTLGFIGAGAMAEALAKGFVNGGVADFGDISVSHSGNADTAKRWQDLGASVLNSNAEILDRCDCVFFAVKPHILPQVLNEVGAHVDVDRHLFVSVAAGVSSQFIEDNLKKSAQGGIAPGRPGPGTASSSESNFLNKLTKNKKDEKNTKLISIKTPRVVRVMPNTPCLVNEAASAVSPGTCSTPDDLQLVSNLMQSVGLIIQTEERSMDAVVGVSGSGPAYGFLFIEALADGGVAAGLPRDVSLKLAAQTLLGAAKMVIETGEHPCVLKDKVCSPGGTTIQAVRALEANGFRSAVIEAVLASASRSAELGVAQK